MESKERAKALLEWLTGIVGLHPVMGAMVVQALVDVTKGEDALVCHEEDSDGANGDRKGMSRGVAIWSAPRVMPCWSGTDEGWWPNSTGKEKGVVPAWRRRLDAFPPHLESSYLTSEEGRELFHQGMRCWDARGPIGSSL